MLRIIQSSNNTCKQCFIYKDNNIVITTSSFLTKQDGKKSNVLRNFIAKKLGLRKLTIN